MVDSAIGYCIHLAPPQCNRPDGAKEDTPCFCLVRFLAGRFPLAKMGFVGSHWLVFGATLAFLSAILSYEVAIFLLPIAVVLNLHLIEGRRVGKLGMSLWVTLLTGIAFFVRHRIVMECGSGIRRFTAGAGQSTEKPENELVTHGKPGFSCGVFFLDWNRSLCLLRGVKDAKKDGRRLENVGFTLKQQVPDVSEGSTFVLVNAGFGRTGCIRFMNMLYDRSKLHCIHLLDGDIQDAYTRTEGGLIEDISRFFAERFIIMTLDEQGKATILDRIESEDYPDMSVTWASGRPIAHELFSDSPIDITCRAQL